MAVLREVIASFVATVDDRELTQLDKTMDKVMVGVKALGAALGLTSLASWAKDAVLAASDVAEEMNVLTETFKGSSDAVLDWANTAQTSLGRSEYTLRKMAGTFGAFLDPLFKGDKGKIADLSTQLAALAVDLGSFYNIADEEATTRLFSGLAGETEAVRRLGIDLTEAGLKTFALTQGITKNVQSMTQAEKTQLRFDKILADTTTKQGDAARTSGQFANTLKRLQEQLKTLSVAIGGKLLGGLTRFMGVLESVIGWVTHLADKTMILESAVVAVALRFGWAATTILAANQTLVFGLLRSWALVAARFAVVSAGISVILIAIEDLLVLFSGGKSMIGEFIDSIAGIGATEEAVISIKQGWDLLVYSIQKAIYEAKKFAGLDVGAEPEDPEQIRERRRQEAVASGDVNAFAREHAAGRTREQAVDDFKASRAAYLKQHPEAATEKDVNSGLAAKVGTSETAAKTVSAPKSKGGATVNNSSNVVVNLPPGTSDEQVERIRKIVADEQAKQNARSVANGQEEGDV